MSSTEITFAIAAVIIICIIAVYIVQSRERARVEQIRKLNAARERHRYLQQLLHELPPQYLTNELRVMILDRAIETLYEIVKIKNDSRTQEALQQDQEQLKVIKEKNPSFKPTPVRDEETAKNVRRLLEVLLRFIQVQHRRKALDGVSAKKYQDQIMFSAAQSRADLFNARATAAHKAGKPRVAIHNYHNAIAAFKDVPNNAQAVQLISKYRAKIKELEEVADEHNRKVKEDAQKKLEQNDEWSSFLDNDKDDWKKKNTYDD